MTMLASSAKSRVQAIQDSNDRICEKNQWL